MENEIGESKYAKKYVQRARAGGPMFKSLGISDHCKETMLPLPAPLHYDYTRPYQPVNEFLTQREAINTLLPFERLDQIAKYRRPHAR